MIRVVLPFHLRNLAQLNGEAVLDVKAPVTLGGVLDALENLHPVLRGTNREHGTLKRRPFVRFYACREDWSLKAAEARLPDAITTGEEPLLIVGAIAGG